jgi:anthranilate synthase component 1
MQVVPTREEFLRLSRQGNVVPVRADLLADLETPVSAYAKLRGPGPAFLLESVEGGENVSRYSFIGCNPRKILRAMPGTPDPLTDLQEELAKYQPVAVPGLPPFTGGAVGYLGYEFIHSVEKTVPLAARDELGVPMMWFMLCDSVLAFDRAHQTMRLIVNAHVGADANAAYDAACAELQRMRAALAQPCPLASATLGDPGTVQVPAGNFTKAAFEQMVEDSKEFIRAGDIFQIVLSQRFSRDFTRSPLDLYRALRTVNPSPYMFLLETGDFALVGASPEVHVRLTGRKVEIRPSPARGRAARPRRRMSPWRRICWPTKRNWRNTSCWLTWRATTSAASAPSAPSTCRNSRPSNATPM